MKSLRKQTEEAKALARGAAVEYMTGNNTRATELHREAERACAEIIKAIVKLTEAEADLVEPRFTELEEQLFALGSLRFRLSPD